MAERQHRGLAGRMQQWLAGRMAPDEREGNEHLTAMGRAVDREERRGQAELALAAYKRRWDARDPDAVVGPGKRPDVPLIADLMAVAAFEAGRLDEAAEYATEAVRVALAWRLELGGFAEKSQPLNEQWARGQQVLGRLALVRGDADEAERRLRATFDLGHAFIAPPRFELAAELVQAGRTHAVIDYIAECKKIRPLRAAPLDEWIRCVEGGEVPDAWSTYPPT